MMYLRGPALEVVRRAEDAVVEDVVAVRTVGEEDAGVVIAANGIPEDLVAAAGLSIHFDGWILQTRVPQFDAKEVK